MPSQFFDALFVVFSNERFSLFFIIQQHDALQQSIRELKFAYSLSQVITNIHQELVVAVCFKLNGNSFFDFCTEFFFTLHCVFAKHLIKQFLVQFCRNHAGDFFHLEAEVTFNVRNFFFLDFQQ